jgi:hypothetical protein
MHGRVRYQVVVGGGGGGGAGDGHSGIGVPDAGAGGGGAGPRSLRAPVRPASMSSSALMTNSSTLISTLLLVGTTQRIRQ